MSFSKTWLVVNLVFWAASGLLVYVTVKGLVLWGVPVIMFIALSPLYVLAAHDMAVVETEGWKPIFGTTRFCLLVGLLSSGMWALMAAASGKVTGTRCLLVMALFAFPMPALVAAYVTFAALLNSARSFVAGQRRVRSRTDDLHAKLKKWGEAGYDVSELEDKVK